MMSTTCTAAILAGGQATRLNGRNKAELSIGDMRLLERQLAVLREVVDRIVIIANDQARYQSYGLPIVPDLAAGSGALGAVYTAIQSTSTDHTLVVACDMPFLHAPFLAHLVDAGRDVDVAIPRTAHGYEPLCAVYSRRCAASLRRQLETKRWKVADLLACNHGLNVREIGPREIAAHGDGDRLFFNINTNEDYERALRLAHD
jgi:molybdopterin-guanine dinucleotide biosynthesis protein A